MDGSVEVITGRERQWRWSLQDKVRVVAETNEPGSMIRAVTARHGICESLLFTWRRQAREGLMGSPGMDAELAALPDDVDALKAALLAARADRDALVSLLQRLPTSHLQSKLLTLQQLIAELRRLAQRGEGVERLGSRPACVQCDRGVNSISHQVSPAIADAPVVVD